MRGSGLVFRGDHGQLLLKLARTSQTGLLEVDTAGSYMRFLVNHEGLALTTSSDPNPQRPHDGTHDLKADPEPFASTALNLGKFLKVALKVLILAAAICALLALQAGRNQRIEVSGWVCRS